jgi:hypothetical protein
VRGPWPLHQFFLLPCLQFLTVCVDVFNRVKLVFGGDTHDCGNVEMDGCFVRGCAELRGGVNVCGSVVVERAVVTTLAGIGTASFSDGSGTNAGFYFPVGVAVDASGNVFLADQYNHRIRKSTAFVGMVMQVHCHHCCYKFFC